MRASKFQKETLRTVNKGLDWNGRVSNALLGIQGETGEVADIFKKYLYQGHSIDFMDVREEIGDVLYYIGLLCETMDMDMEEIMKENIEKLRERYPEGFSEENSINRKEYL